MAEQEEEGDGGGGGGGEGEEKGEKQKKKKQGPQLFMWGFLPGASVERAPLLSPSLVPSPTSGDVLKDVCGGGCGFAMAISESGKLFTWGSTDDMGQSHVTSGGHELPEQFHLPTDVPIVKAAAGWAHCASVTEKGEVHTWGWRECIPSGNTVIDSAATGAFRLEDGDGRLTCQSDEGNHRKCSTTDNCDYPQASLHASSDVSQNGAGHESKSSSIHSDVTEGSKRRRLLYTRQTQDGTDAAEEDISAPLSLVTVCLGTKVTMVATGGRHTLALSDSGQLWGWGYGGEGQLGLGSRVRSVSSPHIITCFGASSYQKQRLQACSIESSHLDEKVCTTKPYGSYIKAIACGGRHSAVITDAGTLLTFGWGLYGQCGQGSTDDKLSPTVVASLGGIPVEGVGAGLWHTVCISKDGDVYAFGGNQFGQLGIGEDQAMTLPKLLEDAILENKHVKIVSCGARHSAIVTEDGKAFSWGWNKYGQLGLGDAVDRNLPLEVPFKGYLVKNIACGWWHTLALAEHSDHK
ncbi:ultraviolet-B receptor UVR8-like isoform X2 [Nymphaea colorata]|uniref:ultraviolet-B receptor UVR8-like isoform X2 n=1 Tax=Nymphaea colorata TaxID=210225 RepID=UPI00214E2C5F|nr:ultraviolet-B receptor UVR8-like isoform X2 [Nymphaea colorata]